MCCTCFLYASFEVQKNINIHTTQAIWKRYLYISRPRDIKCIFLQGNFEIQKDLYNHTVMSWQESNLKVFIHLTEDPCWATLLGICWISKSKSIFVMESPTYKVLVEFMKASGNTRVSDVLMMAIEHLFTEEFFYFLLLEQIPCCGNKILNIEKNNSYTNMPKISIYR